MNRREESPEVPLVRALIRKSASFSGIKISPFFFLLVKHSLYYAKPRELTSRFDRTDAE